MDRMERKRIWGGHLAGRWSLPGPADAEDVKVGILFGVTGQFADFVPPLLDAVRLAVDEVNGNGGILRGQKLQTVLGDTKGTAQGGIDAARKLVGSDNVAAIVGDPEWVQTRQRSGGRG